MELWGLARALHVVGVVVWIGGVAMVTLVLLPAIRSERAADRFALFQRLERRFARQARWIVAVVGLSGVYLAHTMGLDARFYEVRFWWMHAMVFVWIVFAAMLFVLEPLVLHRWLERRAVRDADGTLRLMHRLHWALLILSVAAIAGAAAGAHGLTLLSVMRSASRPL